MIFRRFLLAAALLAAPLSAQQQPAYPAFDGFVDSVDGHSFDVFVDAPDWKFFRTPSYCYAVEENDRGTLLVGYDQRRNEAHLAFWNTSITSYAAADTTNFEIVLVNIVPGQGLGPLNREWGLHKFLVAINRTGQRVFNTRLNGTELLASLSRYDRLVFLSPTGTIAQNFALAQSARALKRLAACRPR